MGDLGSSRLEWGASVESIEHRTRARTLAAKAAPEPRRLQGALSGGYSWG